MINLLWKIPVAILVTAFMGMAITALVFISILFMGFLISLPFLMFKASG